MKDKIFYNKDYDINIEIKKNIMKMIYEACELSYPKETGGVLFGYYLETNFAIVTDMWEEKKKENKSRTKFLRGTKGLKDFSDKLWDENGKYYLGEWHYHPGSSCIASCTDKDTIINISKNEIYKCPEPIMLILGGRKVEKFTEITYMVSMGKIIVLR